MTEKAVIEAIAKNLDFHKEILAKVSEKEALWKADENTWCLLELVCHLLDEEKEDFKARIQHLFKYPNTHPPAIDPQGWVTERNYIQQNYHEVLQLFFEERSKSIQWLKSLENAPWDNAFEHAHFGKMTASLYLTNWLAHDYFHFKQIFKIKYLYLQSQAKHSLNYAAGL